MIKVKGITKDFFSPFSLKRPATRNPPLTAFTRALDSVSFDLAQGSSLAILGPNGAGKTTLLKVLATVILPEKGIVEINGWKSGKDDERIKSCLGLVGSCERSFYWRLTGRQNLEFFSAMYGLYGRNARLRIEELAGLFKTDFLDRRFDSYSAGMQQKCGLMRAMLHDPAVLLLDEPTKSLDYNAACDLRNFVKEDLVKKQKKTVLFTTHNMNEAEDFADVFLVLHKGRVKALGRLEDLRTSVNDQTASLEQIFVRLTSEG